MVSVSTRQSREDSVEYLPAIQKLFGSFKGDAFKLRVLPFFHVCMCDVLAKHHPGNGMIEHGRLLLVDVIVVKHVISIRIKSIALEAFGRHLKRVDASVLFFCLDVRFSQAKQGSHLGRNKYPAVFRFGTRGLRVLFGSAGKKSETSEHTPIFGNKTAGRGRLKRGPGRPISSFHRTSGIARRTYAANFGTLEHIVLFMKRTRR